MYTSSMYTYILEYHVILEHAQVFSVLISELIIFMFTLKKTNSSIPKQTRRKTENRQNNISIFLPCELHLFLNE